MVRIFVKKWFADKNGLSASMDGDILRETDKAVYFKGHMSVDAPVVCGRCGLELTHPISRLIGIGPTCCEHLGIPRPSEDEMDIEGIKEQLKARTAYEGWLPKSQIDTDGDYQVAPENKPAEVTRIVAQEDKLYLRCPFEDNDKAKMIPGCRWDKKTKAWSFPASPHVAERLEEAFGGHCFEGAAIGILEKSQIYKEKQAVKSSVDLPDHPSLTDSWLHQKQAYQFAKDFPGAGIFMEMGTGKTKVAIDIMANRGDKKILVVAPKRVLRVWSREFAKHSISPVNVVPLTQSTNQAKANQIANYDGPYPVAFITNYDVVWRDPLASVVMNYGFDCVVADEVHRIKKPGGKASMFMYRLGLKVSHRLGLTGTPMPHSPLDIYGVYRFLEPGILGTNYARFESRYAVKGGYEGRQVVGYRNLDELHERIYRIAFRVKSADVLDLPEPIYETCAFQLSGEARRIYRQMEKDSVVTFQQAGSLIADNVLTQLLRLQQITSGYLPGEDGIRLVDTSKKDLLGDILGDIDTKEPIVVFARFIHDLEQIRGVVESQGRKYAELSGRMDQLEEWKNGDYDVIAVQIQSGGEGENFTRARYTIYYSLGFSLKDYEQSLFRTLRPGQTRSPMFIHLVAEGTVDEKIMKALQDRKQVVESVLNDYREKGAGD